MKYTWRKRLLCFVLFAGLGVLFLSTQSYGYNALVSRMIYNLNRLQNIIIGMAMSDFDQIAGEAKSLASNAEAIRGLAHVAVSDGNPQRIEAFQDLAHELKEHAEKLQAAAQERNGDEIRQQFSEVLEYCLKCHQQFRD